ncbi:hypothetical protein Mal15_47540 [Stieleria maiorica]|uniref:DUF4350 domain-containing protein n=1 Tax=Stieleria maiorica TaxID=2795974 RepID=A0A5B9MHC4_9BACT|nr:hypothetical protein [Stieleria maiorica]QEG00683.1 hypothetical protein Mal15_47540 [Stieleria maiorica]
MMFGCGGVRTDSPVSAVVLALLITGGMIAEAAAQFSVPEILSTHRVELPSDPAPGSAGGGSGFKAAIEVTDLMGVGYVAVDVTLTSTGGPMTAERNLSLRLTPIDRHLPAERAIATTFPLTFPQGQTQVELSRSSPKWTIGNSYRIEIFEDGAPLSQYSVEVGSRFPGYAIQSPATVLANELTCNFMFVETKPVPVEVPADVIRVIPPARARNATIPPTVQTTSLSRLPTDWRRLRDLDCIIIQGDKLEAFASDPTATTPNRQREAIRAIRDWVLMGGTLVVLEAPDAIRLAQTLRLKLLSQPQEDQLFRALVAGVASAKTAELEDDRSILSSWVERVPASQSDPSQWDPSQWDPSQWDPSQPDPQTGAGSIPSAGFGPPPVQRTSLAQRTARTRWIEDREARIKTFTSQWSQAYRRDVGGGQVVGLPMETFDPLLGFDLLEQLIGFRRSAMLTRGVDPMMGDFRSRRWLIPGVAEPPVYTFMGILTLFVLLVGPVAYRWTTRGHRSHLMFLIAPALALVTTAAMFTYSIVSDGFGTTIRVRQLTWIDGASGDAVERTRSTLFAGISPRTGLRFSADEEVMAYPSGGQQMWQDLSSDLNEVRLQVDIDQSEQWLDPAFLPSRTQTQFVTHRVRRGVGAISFSGATPFDSGGSVPNATAIELSSSLPFELRDLVVCTPDGRYWSTDKIDAGSTAAAKWIPQTQDASKLLGNLYIRYRPVGAVSESGRSTRSRRIRDLPLFLNRELSRGGVVVTDGVFEHWLNDTLFVRGELPPGTFVGLSSPSRDSVPIGDAEQVASVRYVMGTLQ